jgi:hypothetical protein
MDDMNYWYYKAGGGVYRPDPKGTIPSNATNQLAYVDDSHRGQFKADDITMTQDLNNYTYDLIGNLISKDEAENIDKITWNLQNKVAAIEKSAGADLVFNTMRSGGASRKRSPMGKRKKTPAPTMCAMHRGISWRPTATACR